jgi:ribonuclease BN (tRNA processing enzyme)
MRHTAGLPDLILTPPTVGRSQPLVVYGPPGTEKMIDHVLSAYTEDLAMRTSRLRRRKASGHLLVRRCTPEDLIAELRASGYEGEVAVGSDLAVQ